MKKENKKLTIFEAELNIKLLINNIKKLHNEIFELVKKLTKAKTQIEKDDLIRQINHTRNMERKLVAIFNEMNTSQWLKNNCKDFDAWSK